jgi:outer membrane receptor protein involved in Fe transport
MELPPAAEEIVVLAPRLPEAPGEEAYSAFPIDPLLLEQAARVDDALRISPGVSLFRRTDSAAANPTIQGLSIRASAPSGAGRALVLLEGQPLNDPFGGWVIWGALPPATIANATVLRGAGAGPYGAGALSGTVQLTERRGQGAALSLEAGEYGHFRASAVGEASNAQASLMLAAAVQHEDGWIPVRARRGAADTELWYEGAAAVARAEWRGDGLVFSSRLSGYSESRGAGLAGAESNSDGGGIRLALAEPSRPFGWRLQAWAQASDLANSSVGVAPDRSNTTPANTQYSTPALGWGANAAARWSGEDAGLELGADLRVAEGETRELFAFSGGVFTRSRIAGGRTLTTGAYVETWRNAENWTLTGGARADLYRAEDGRRLERLIVSGATTLSTDADDTEVVMPTVRLGARRAFGASYLRAAAYTGFRPPTLNELHRPFRIGNDVTEANPALDPETIAGVDFGAGGDHAAWRWEAGVFATRLDDAIINVTLGAGPGAFPPGVFVPAGGAYRQRLNAGRIDAVGIEARANGEWGYGLSWRAALNYTRARVDGGATVPALTDRRPAQSPQWAASAGLSWQAAATSALSVAAIYESARFEDDLNTRELSPALTIDVRAEHTLLDGLILYAALDNALNADVETAETADGVESFAPPRALRIGLRITR